MQSHNGAIDTTHTPPPPLSFYNTFNKTIVLENGLFLIVIFTSLLITKVLLNSYNTLTVWPPIRAAPVHAWQIFSYKWGAAGWGE